MRLLKLILLLLFGIGLQASRPLSGLNKKEFLITQQSLIEWEKNPFLQSTDHTGINDLNLLAIVYSKNNSAALINDQVVKIGDKIGSSEVVSIQKQEVILRNENGIFQLTLRGKKK